VTSFEGLENRFENSPTRQIVPCKSGLTIEAYEPRNHNPKYSRYTDARSLGKITFEPVNYAQHTPSFIDYEFDLLFVDFREKTASNHLLLSHTEL